MSFGGEIIANDLLPALLSGEDFTLPTVDFSDNIYQIPGDNTAAMYQPVVKLTNAELTQQRTDGEGTFDVIMGGFRAQLAQEYKEGRITGAEYTKAFTALAESAMANAVQFLISRDQGFWQAATAQAQAITARVALETAKVQYAAVLMEAKNNKAQYGLTKLKLATEDAQYGQLKFNVDNILPLQEDLLSGQVAGQTTQNSIATFQLNTMLQEDQLTAQITGIDKQNAVLDYQLTTQLPAQTQLVNEQKEAARAQTLDTRSNTDPVTGVLGKQKELYDQQKVSYAKASKLNAAKMLSDAYLTVGAVEDFTGGPATNISRDEINEVYTAIRADNALGS